MQGCDIHHVMIRWNLVVLIQVFRLHSPIADSRALAEIHVTEILCKEQEG